MIKLEWKQLLRTAYHCETRRKQNHVGLTRTFSIFPLFFYAPLKIQDWSVTPLLHMNFRNNSQHFQMPFIPNHDFSYAPGPWPELSRTLKFYTTSVNLDKHKLETFISFHLQWWLALNKNVSCLASKCTRADLG